MKESWKEKMGKNGKVIFSVAVRTQASKTAVTGQLADGTIKIDLKAVPEQGKANVVLRKFLAKEFNVAIDQVSIVKGSSSRRKLVRIVYS